MALHERAMWAWGQTDVEEEHAPGARRRTRRRAGSRGREGRGGQTSGPQSSETRRGAVFGSPVGASALQPAEMSTARPCSWVGAVQPAAALTATRDLSSLEGSTGHGAGQLGLLARVGRPCWCGEASPLERKKTVI